jgi:hypothetical protein
MSQISVIDLFSEYHRGMVNPPVFNHFSEKFFFRQDVGKTLKNVFGQKNLDFYDEIYEIQIHLSELITHY